MQPNQIAIVLTGLWMLGLSPVFADPSSPSSADSAHEERMEGRMKRLHEQLHLTPDQEKKLKEHRQAHRAEGKKLRDAMKAKHEALEAEMSKPNFDEGKVKSLHSELAALRTQMEDHRLQGILDVRKILTPEQFAKFRELTKNEWKEHGDKDKQDEHGPRGDKP